MGYSKQSNEDRAARVKGIRSVLWIVLVLNVVVALAKLLYGLYIASVAMQADGFHSMFDGTSNIVGLIGIALAARPADKSHPYGHGKYETYASAAIGGMLVFAGWEVLSNAWIHLFGNAPHARVDAAAFVVMLLTLAVNFSVTTYERRMGRKLGSEILIADSQHTRSDMLVSLGVIAGLGAVALGFPDADPIIAIFVAGAIFYAAFNVLKKASSTLSDTSRIDPREVCDLAKQVKGVRGCHTVRTRGSESEVYVDMHIQVDRSVTVEEGHSIAEEVERVVANGFAQVVDVIVHLEPEDEYQKRKTEEQVRTGDA